MSDSEVKKVLEDILAGKSLTFDPGLLLTLTPGLQACVNEVKNLTKRLNKLS